MKNAPAPQDRFGPKIVLLLAGVLVGVIIGSVVYGRRMVQEQVFTTVRVEDNYDATEEFKLGEKLAQQRCSTCHLQPEPMVLDKVNWGMEILPAMGEWLGIRDFPYEELNLADRVREAAILPRDPQISIEEWRSICAYYIATSPNQIAPLTNRPPLIMGLKHFEVFIPPKTMPAFTTMVKIDPVTRTIFTGSASNNSLTILDAQAQVLHTMETPSPPVDIQIRADGYMVTLIGSYTPSDLLEGRIGFLAKPGSTTRQNQIVLSELPRPVNTHFVDLNGDGIEDILVCGYGNLLGELAWYQGKPGGGYEKRVIQDRPGAIKAVVQDFTRDGKPDIMVMFAQAKETIELMINKGGGVFESQLITAKHPAWGFASFEIVDANGDGHPDILACNGDNGDHVRHIPPFKPYHGIRLYLNDGKNNFTESWFHPLNGAYKTITRDFDQDGDLDIAAISFYADYRHHPREGFIYLENKGGWNFDTYTFNESIQGRWLTMDAGDLDGDGDLDIVLGCFVDGPTYVPGLLHDKWREVTPPVFILRNKTRP